MSPPDAPSGGAAASGAGASTGQDHEAISHHRRVSLALDRPQIENENQDDRYDRWGGAMCCKIYSILYIV